MPNLRAATSGCLIFFFDLLKQIPWKKQQQLITYFNDDERKKEHDLTIIWNNKYHPPVNACHGYSRRSMVKSLKYAWNNCFLLSQNSIWKSPWNAPGWFSSVASTNWSIP